MIKRVTYIKGTTENNVTPSYAFYILPDTGSTLLRGYTIMPRTGSGLGRADVIAHLNSSNYEYDVVFTLESQADYLQVDAVQSVS